MPATEQRERMRLMREIVRSRNVYRWAGQMLLDAVGPAQAQAYHSNYGAAACPERYAAIARGLSRFVD